MGPVTGPVSCIWPAGGPAALSPHAASAHAVNACDTKVAVHALCTAGGVSMGDRDLIKPLLERQGTIHFGRVLMKPGKPLTFATLALKEQGRSMLLVFGLPGRPTCRANVPAGRGASAGALPLPSRQLPAGPGTSHTCTQSGQGRPGQGQPIWVLARRRT